MIGMTIAANANIEQLAKKICSQLKGWECQVVFAIPIAIILWLTQ